MTKVRAGHYRYEDDEGNIFVMKLVYSEQTGRTKEKCWELSINGKVQLVCYETLGDAKLASIGYKK